MSSPTYQPATDAGTKRRRDTNTVPFWVPYAGIESGTGTAKTLQLVHALCNIQGLDSAGIEYLNEETINALGKTVRTVNDGRRISDFNCTVRGNDVATLYALLGLNWNDYVSANVYDDHGVKGALCVASFSIETGVIERWDVIFDVAVKVSEMPFGTVGSATDQTVTFYSDSARLYTLPPGYAPAFEIFYDDGTGTDIVSAAAPDGVLTDFDLGAGNGSYATTTNPAANAIEALASQTGYKQLFYKVMVDGVEQSTAVVSYSTATTNHLVFTTAPADGAKLFIAYAVKLADFDWPNLREDLTTGAKADWATVLQATA